MITTFAVETLRQRPSEAKARLEQTLNTEGVSIVDIQLMNTDKTGHLFRVQASDTQQDRQKLKRLFGEYNMVSEQAKEDERQKEKIRRRIEKLEEELARLKEALGE